MARRDPGPKATLAGRAHQLPHLSRLVEEEPAVATRACLAEEGLARTAERHVKEAPSFGKWKRVAAGATAVAAGGAAWRLSRGSGGIAPFGGAGSYDRPFFNASSASSSLMSRRIRRHTPAAPPLPFLASTAGTRAGHPLGLPPPSCGTNPPNGHARPFSVQRPHLCQCLTSPSPVSDA